MTGDPTRVPCPLRSAALASPDAEAVVGPGWAISYGELDRRVSASERGMGDLGIQPGGRVALYLPKSLDYLVLLLALMRAGLVACPVSTRLPAAAVAPLLEEAGCSVLVSADEDLRGATDEIPVVDPDVLLADGAGYEGPPGPLDVSLARPATIVFTSGSTGIPKAALHTFGNHYYSALGSNDNIRLRPGDRWLHSLPPYHVGGLSIIFRCLLAGAAVALPGPEATIGGSIPDLRVTHVSLVSTQLLRLLREDADLSGLEAVLMGGGPIDPTLVDGASELSIPVHTSYGLTEMASQVTATPPGAPLKRLYTAGRVLAHREVRVSEDGEILVRGETLFSGYVRDGRPDLPLDGEGWFHTGDLGELDAEGYLRVAGRRDNLFVSGGENVQPEEVEEALCRIEGVEEAVVVPVPDGEFGARPVAFVRTNGEAGDLAPELGKTLPRFKIPVAFHDWEGTGGMKPDRPALRRRAETLNPVSPPTNP
ncbi:o-succinylbenzoate--CoA ligase [Rubrobacter tropicus]|uniref:O-succinylbenzoate--CoA ligase n=1 Tax=Rubrobacter tropicus TaxID=2653851 RepID=A0A6G8QC47_9ACTN|nr:o-succinylbenzoate--CoA ligase [Rubrobacter tropicus]QIN84012.1 o-succinylbenzoate--CoA ligase [Rubrobacter tropicus]